MTGPGWPDERGWLVILAAGIFVYVLSLVAFVPDLDKSQLFTALASGVAGAVFRDVVGMWTSSTKAGTDLAAKAMEAASPTGSPKPVIVANPPGAPVPVADASSPAGDDETA